MKFNLQMEYEFLFINSFDLLLSFIYLEVFNFP